MTIRFLNLPIQLTSNRVDISLNSHPHHVHRRLNPPTIGKPRPNKGEQTIHNYQSLASRLVFRWPAYVQLGASQVQVHYEDGERKMRHIYLSTPCNVTRA